ncbi:MAG TPA: sigma-70 family RNA polymerase sigma factor [Bryobacteraceae bacterium]|nr:sigma-70 family RNA polymerase sigma factor [Bryobacteraceae bacterium]
MADSILMQGSDTVSADAARTLRDTLFDRALQENGPALLRLASAYTNTQGDRDDLFQEIAFAIWQALPAFRGDSSFRTYLFRIAHNRGLAHLASRKPLQTVDEEDLRLHDPMPNPERRLEIEEQRRNLLAAVRRLPIVYRHVITLALEGLSYPEIAEILGLTEANVGIRLNRARKALRKMLD